MRCSNAPLWIYARTFAGRACSSKRVCGALRFMGVTDFAKIKSGALLHRTPKSFPYYFEVLVISVFALFRAFASSWAQGCFSCSLTKLMPISHTFSARGISSIAVKRRAKAM